MKRHELEHLIRAAGAITGSDEIIVFLVEMCRHQLVDENTLRERVALLEVPAEDRLAAEKRWQRISLASGRESQ